LKPFVGLDVSLEKTAICVLIDLGKSVKEAQVASEPEALARWIEEQPGRIAAVDLEAGPLPQSLHRGLCARGLDVVLMETRQVQGALKAMTIKTDRTPKVLLGCCIWGGSGLFIANPFQHTKFAPFCRCARRSSRAL
jgi:transposase